jgi:transcriptional regulator with XRE-family HTH domain
MLTLSEFLKVKENQDLVLNSIVHELRDRGKLGKRGLYTEIGEKIGFSPAYTGQVLNGKKALTEKFVEGIAAYFGVPVVWLRGDEYKLKDIAEGIWKDMYDNNPAAIIIKMLQLSHAFMDELEDINSYEVKKQDTLKIAFGFAIEFAFDTASKCMNTVEVDFASSSQDAIKEARNRQDKIAENLKQNKTL